MIGKQQLMQNLLEVMNKQGNKRGTHKRRKNLFVKKGREWRRKKEWSQSLMTNQR